jgi:hypothetical protein
MIKIQLLLIIIISTYLKLKEWRGADVSLVGHGMHITGVRPKSILCENGNVGTRTGSCLSS